MPITKKGPKKKSNVEIDYDSFNRWAVTYVYQGEPAMKLVGTQYFQNYSCPASREQLLDAYRDYLKKNA